MLEGRVSLFLYCLLFTMAASNLFAKSAREVADESAAKENIAQSINYVKSEIESSDTLADKRSMYAFLGSLQEAISLYDDAEKSYASACAIGAADAQGMGHKSNEMLVLDAVRCALCAGDSDAALRYLESVDKSLDSEVIAKSALYKQWGILCSAQGNKGVSSALEKLRGYAEDKKYSSIRAKVLLTLWYVGGDNEAKRKLLQDEGQSIEAAIAGGKIQMLPVPFWYFGVGRGGGGESAKNDTQASSEIGATLSSSLSSLGGGEKDESGEAAKPVKLQLGLFRERSNAESLLNSLSTKGFRPVITTEKRESGTVYYIVVIEETTKAIEDELRTAGFEFYPVF